MNELETLSKSIRESANKLFSAEWATCADQRIPNPVSGEAHPEPGQRRSASRTRSAEKRIPNPVSGEAHRPSCIQKEEERPLTKEEKKDGWGARPFYAYDHRRMCRTCQAYWFVEMAAQTTHEMHCWDVRIKLDEARKAIAAGQPFDMPGVSGSAMEAAKQRLAAVN